MGLTKPAVEFAEEMTEPYGWPDLDENIFRDRASELIGTRDKVAGVLQSWRSHRDHVFDFWFGRGADAGSGAIEERIREITYLKDSIEKAAAWYGLAASHIYQVKTIVARNLKESQKIIDAIRSNFQLDSNEREAAVRAFVKAQNAVNTSVVVDIAAELPTFETWQPPPSSIPPIAPSRDGTSTPTSPPTSLSDGPTAANPSVSPLSHVTQLPTTVDGRTSAEAVAPTSSGIARPDASSPPSSEPISATPPPALGAPSATSSPSTSMPAGASGGAMSSGPSSPTASTPSALSNGPSASGPSAGISSAPATSGQPPGAAASPAAAQSMPVQSAVPQAPLQAPAAATSPGPAPAAPTPSAPAPPSAAGISTSSGVTGGAISPGGGAAPGAGAAPGPSAPAPPVPLGPPTTPPPAAPSPPGVPPSATMGPGVMPASTSNNSTAAAAAPVPVSPARAERDAIATASTASALRRQSNGNDPLQLARRIGAALNVGIADFGFFWVTGVTTDDVIVVANSYGLAYIPAEVKLPTAIRMATADESIPAADRAKWATYPILAVQGWAQHRHANLRAVVATEDQFAQFDPGVPKIVLQDDDIPSDGKMHGRNRLEVISPAAAKRLSSVSDIGLSSLLPPPLADSQPPIDRSRSLWFDVAKPLMSTSTQRGTAHLQAFITYAEHAQELSVYRAHTLTDAVAQRAAIADWVYWQHLCVLMSDAIGARTSA